MTLSNQELVCPYDLGTLSSDGERRLRCASGHVFAVQTEIPDLVIAEVPSAYLHHVPGETATYEDELKPARRSAHFGRIGFARTVWRAARFYCDTVPRARRVFPADLVARPPAPPDHFRAIHGATSFTHEVTKRLEKALFWDEVELPEPACELGIHSGESSRYFFADRSLTWGSNYVSAKMQRPRAEYPHRHLFAANIKFLPFSDGALSSLCCSQTLTVAYASISSILAEINRVLAPGGRFAFTTHGPAFLSALPRDGWPEMGLSAAECRRRTLRRSSYMSQLYTPDEWKQLLAAHGFEIERSRGLLSTRYSRFVQLFYAEEMLFPPIFTPRFQTPRMRLVKALAGLSAEREAQIVTQLDTMMGAILAYELNENRGAPFDDVGFLDAGIVAIKQRDANVARLAPRPARL